MFYEKGIQENIYAEVSFQIKLQVGDLGIFKRRYFSLNFTKPLRTPILQNTFETNVKQV